MEGSNDSAAAAPRHRCRGAIKWAWRVCALLIIASLGLLHLLPVLTNTAPVKAFVVRVASGVLNDSHVTIRTLKVAPLRRRLLLIRGLTLTPPGTAQEPAIELDQLECHWLPRALLSRRVRLLEVAGRGLSVNLRCADGEWNVLRLLPPTEEPLRLTDLRLPLPVQVDSVSADDVTLTADMPGVFNVRVDGISARGSARLREILAGRGDVELRTGPIRAAAGAHTVLAREGAVASLRFTNLAGRPKVSALLWVPALGGSIEGLGQTREAPLEAGLGAEFDLANLQMPRADLYARSPGLFDERMSLSLSGGPKYQLAGRSHFALDLAALKDMAPPALPDAQLEGWIAAETDLTGKFAIGPQLRAEARVTNTVYGGDIRAALPASLGGPLDGTLSGLRFIVSQNVDLRSGQRLEGLARVALLSTVDELSGEIEDSGSFTGRGIRNCMSMDVGLPALEFMDVRGSFSGEDMRVEAPGLGGLALPARATLRLSGDALLDPSRMVIDLEELSGRLGEVVPGFWLSGGSGAGLSRPHVSGGALLNVERAMDLMDGLDERLRAAAASVRMRGRLGGAFFAGGRLPGPIGCVLRGVADLRDISFDGESASVSLNRLGGFIAGGGSVDAGLWPGDLWLSAAGSLEAPKAAVEGLTVALKRAEGKVSARALRVESPGIQIDGAVDLDQAQASLPGADGETIRGRPLSVRIKGRAVASPLAGDLSVEDAAVEVGKFLQVTVPGFSLRGFGTDAAQLDAGLTVADLGELLDAVASWLPPELAGALPAASGSLSANGGIEGRLPLVEQLAARLASGKGLSLGPLFPLRDFCEQNAPLDIRARLSSPGISASKELGPGLTAGVSDVSVEAELNFAQGDGAARATVRIPQVELTPSPLPLRDFNLEAEVGLKDFDRVEVKKFDLSALGDVLSLRGSATLEGLSRFIEPPDAAALLEKLDLTARSEGTVRPGGLSVIEGLETSGEAGWKVELSLQGGEALRLRLEPRLNGLSVNYAGLLAVTDLTGGFGIEKRWDIIHAAPGGERLSQSLVAEERPSPAAGLDDELAEYATGADQLLAPAEAIELGDVSVLGMDLVQGFRAELAAHGADVEARRFFLRLLDGKLTGRLSLQGGPEGRRLRVRGEFGGIDLGRMLPDRMAEFRGDSQVAGSFTLTALLAGREALSYNPIKDVSGRLSVTHIGPKALDRLLLSLDPEGENPSIVRLRKLLKLGGPRGVDVRLQRGFVSIEVELQGLPRGLGKRYSIPRFNVGRALSSEKVLAVWQRAAPLVDLLGVIEVDGISISPDGTAGFVRAEDVESIPPGGDNE